MQREDDEAWRAIIDNYGDRADIHEETPPVDRPVDQPLDQPVERPAEPARSWDDGFPDSDWSTDRFVPPPPPPVPTTTTDRMFAWAGVFGSPAILLVCLVFRIDIPQLIAYLLVAGFVGGFLYLVVKMSREPRDPGDDGAVL